jgi:hypothetical protein
LVRIAREGGELMDFLGKRSDRVRLPRQLGLDPEIGRIVRQRAHTLGRSIEMELVHLIEVGIRNDPESRGNAQFETLQHGAAPQRTELHTAAREKLAG